jgi:hypothetical protein
MKNILLLFVLSAAIVACKQERKEVVVTKEIKPGDQPDNNSQVKLVDQFYTALTARDSAGVVNLMAENAKLYGSDPSEDWNLDQIKSYMSERMRDTTVKAVFKVKKREVRIMNDLMLVTDEIEISTIRVPFRVVTIAEKKDGEQKIIFSEFSALVRNEDIRQLELLFDKAKGK